jgi:flagellar biosynthesis/type III secretory pathway chaperone
MEKMFIEALAELKGGKKKLRELLEHVLEECEQAHKMRDIWQNKLEDLTEAKTLITKKLVKDEPTD